MKRLVLVVAAVLVLTLGIMSCTPTTESDITTPPPGQEPEETPLDMNWIAYRNRVISNKLMNLRNRYIVHTYNGELGFQIPVNLYLPYTQRLPSYITLFLVADLDSARTHIANVESLSTRGCLPDEYVSREVSSEEITHELEASMSLLQNKVEDTYTQQNRIIAFVEDLNNWWIQEYGESHAWWQITEEDKDIAIGRYAEFFEYYRGELEEAISEHEFILSNLH